MAKLGHEQPEMDNRAYPEGTLFTQFTEQNAPENSAVADQPEAPARIKPVEEIMSEHELRLAERARLYEELSHKNYTQQEIQRELDKHFPDLKSPEQIEREEKARDAAARRHARELHGGKTSRTKRLRRTWDPKGGGPPEHIARENRDY